MLLVLPLARVWPSGLNATELTASVSPVSGFPSSRRVATFHSRMVRSALPLARILPLWLNATDLMAPVSPVSGFPASCLAAWGSPTAWSRRRSGDR